MIALFAIFLLRKKTPIGKNAAARTSKKRAIDWHL